MKTIYKDLISGMAVFLVAMPLCLVIALASGAPMASVLLGGIMGGLIISSIIGSNFIGGRYAWWWLVGLRLG